MVNSSKFSFNWQIQVIKVVVVTLGLFFFQSCSTSNSTDEVVLESSETVGTTPTTTIPTITFETSVSGKNYVCSTASDLQSALSSVVAGDVITVNAGTYVGNFSSSKSGTSGAYIVIQGFGDTTILTSGSTVVGNTALGIKGSYWKIKNMSVTNTSIGVKLDNSDYSIIDNVTVSNTGQEGIHLLNETSYATVKNCRVTNTGNVITKYGEGIYIGSDYGKWLENGGSYNKACDNNIIDSCIVGPGVTAEHIDVKEGVSNLVIKNCTFYGTGISGETGNNSNSFIEVKGSNCTITGNTLYQEDNAKILWAFQVTDSGGWGDSNVFTNNKAYLTGSDVMYLQVTNFSSYEGEPTDNTLDSTNIRYTTTATTVNTYNYDSTGSRK